MAAKQCSAGVSRQEPVSKVNALRPPGPEPPGPGTVRTQNCPALASSTSTRSSISDRTLSRPGSPELDLRLAAASRNRLTVEASKLPDNRPILRASSTSSAPLPRGAARAGKLCQTAGANIDRNVPKRLAADSHTRD